MNGSSTNQRIAVTGLGLTCSVGHDAWSSAAALRAGVARFTTTSDAFVPEEPGGMGAREATVARVSGLVSDDMTGMERGARILVPALSQVLRAPGVRGPGFDEALWSVHCLVDQRGSNSTLSEAFYGRLIPSLPDLPAAPSFLHGRGGEELRHCHFLHQLIGAAEMLRGGAATTAVVACVDSLSSRPTLRRLEHAQVLKSGARPDGIIPGEAGGAVLLETEEHARRRNATIYGFLDAWGVGSEPNPWSGSAPCKAAGLTQAYRAVANSMEDRGRDVRLVVTDLNGQRARSLEWALVESRIFPYPGTERRVWHPADCVGDCGGAAGVVQMVHALGGMLARYSPGKRAFLSNSDENEARRVVCLSSNLTLDWRKAVGY